MNTPVSKPHKFVEFPNVGPNSYRGAIACQYCGHVAFYANWDGGGKVAQAAQVLAKQDCPLSPIAKEITQS